MNETQLVTASLDGDADAYRRLVERYQGRIASRMRRFTRDPVALEELVQDVFVQAYLGLQGYRAHAPFIHWIGRIATRVGYRHWKLTKQKTDREADVSDHLDTLKSELNQWGQYEAGDTLFRLFEKLPAPDRLVVTLHYWDGYATKEIAQQTGWTRTGVKVRLFRARNRLKSMLEEIEKGNPR